VAACWFRSNRFTKKWLLYKLQNLLGRFAAEYYGMCSPCSFFAVRFKLDLMQHSSLRNLIVSAVPAILPTRWFVVFSLTFCFVLPCYCQNPDSDLKDSAWTLVWSDEFTAPDGASVDRSKWVIETGGEGWGNEELEYYTDRPANVFLKDGNLVIRAWAGKYTGPDGVTRNYTSGRLKTLGKFSQKYGRFEARIKVPFGQGIWPAFWMMGVNIAKVGWPACGEIDIMENIGKEPAIVHGSIHGPGYTGAVGIEASYTLPAKARFADDFHVFAVEWSPDSILFYVDQHRYAKRTRADLRPKWEWAFDKPFFLILSLAVGGDWPGNPDASTVFPLDMLVDYVRVYQRNQPPKTRTAAH
jgi:beta-glucanase (GH16 family)